MLKKNLEKLNKNFDIYLNYIEVFKKYKYDP